MKKTTHKQQPKIFGAGVRFKNGAYRYRVPRWATQTQVDNIFGGVKEYKLGKTQYEASVEYARVMKDFLGDTPPILTMGDLIDRYRSQVVPQKAPPTRKSNLISLNRLHSVFSKIEVSKFKGSFAFKYRDSRSDHKTSANRDLEVLGHLFSKAIEWGEIENSEHPLRTLNIKYTTTSRERYVEDWELQEALRVASPFLGAYIGLKTTLGLRKGDMLRLKLTDMKDDGVHSPHSKTKNRTIYDLNENRLKAWNACLSVRPPKAKHSDYLFCTRNGDPYINEDRETSGFDSIWQRFMRKAIEKTELKERFTEHDLRAKVASDSEDPEQARRRLGHRSTKTTKDVYIRRPERAS